jgi:hypothetical protein
MNPADLERLVDAELKRLPPPRAPRTLLPRVLAATARRPPSPWYARPWLSWPLVAQAASIAAAALLVLGVYVFALPVLFSNPGHRANASDVTALLQALNDASALVRVSWRLLLEPVAFVVMVAALTLSLGCAALWSVLDRVALGGASES